MQGLEPGHTTFSEEKIIRDFPDNQYLHAENAIKNPSHGRTNSPLAGNETIGFLLAASRSIIAAGWRRVILACFSGVSAGARLTRIPAAD